MLTYLGMPSVENMKYWGDNRKKECRDEHHPAFLYDEYPNNYSALGAYSTAGASTAGVSAFSAFLARLRRVDLAFFSAMGLSMFSL